MKLQLKLYLPKNATPRSSSTNPSPSSPWPWTTIKRRAAVDPSQEAGDRAQDIEALKAGSVRLELLPARRGKVEVQAVNLYHESKSRRTWRWKSAVACRHPQLNTSAFSPTCPSTGGPHPARPDRLAGAEQGTGGDHQVPAPADVAVGDYEPKIKTSARATTEGSRDKIVRIHVAAKTNCSSAAALLALLLPRACWRHRHSNSNTRR